MSNDYSIIANQSILFTAIRPEIVFECGKGMYIYDIDGKRYLDFVGGWAVNCLGHSPAAIKKALTKQAGLLVNASPSYYNKPMLEYAKLLTEATGFSRVFFASTGAEANEGAFKLARKYGTKFKNGAYEIITFNQAFHGRTLAAMSACGKEGWDRLFEPKVPGFIKVPFNDIAAVRDGFTPKTCAVMLEPIQGEGGVIEAETSFVQELRQLCDEHGLLLIFDEIQTGLGRTGKLLACEHYGVRPDIITLAKGIGGGFPLAAMLTTEELNIFDPGDQGGTYSSQPLAMAVGMAVLNEIIALDLPEKAGQMGAYLIDRLSEIKGRFGLSNIRGKGLLIAFDLPEAKGKAIVDTALNKGLLINSPRPNIIRLMPALTVTEKEIDQMIRILTKVLKKAIG